VYTKFEDMENDKDVEAVVICSPTDFHANHFRYDDNGIHSALPLDFSMDRYAESYYNEMKAFIECLKNNEIPPIPVMTASCLWLLD